PARIRSTDRCRHDPRSAAGHRHGIKPCRSRPLRRSMQHHELTVGRPARTFVLPAVSEDALAAARGVHHTDAERPGDRGKGDEIAGRTPGRRRVASAAEADPALVVTVGSHDIELLCPRTIAFKYDQAAVWREA